MRLDHTGTEVAAAAALQDVLQGQRRQVGGQRRAGLVRQRGIMALAKLRSPVVVEVGLGASGGTHLDQLLLQHQLHLHPGPVFRAIHQGDVQHPGAQQLLHMAGLADFGTNGVGRHPLAQADDPVEDQRIAQAHLAADVEHVAKAPWQRQVPPRRFPGLHQLRGVGHEDLAVDRQPRPGAIAHEESAFQLLLQVLYPRGDGGLGDVQAFGGGDEAAGADDLQEGARQIDIHGRCSDWGAKILTLAAMGRSRLTTTPAPHCGTQKKPAVAGCVKTR